MWLTGEFASVEELVSAVAVHAVESRGVPPALAEMARSATARNMRDLGKDVSDPSTAVRIERYFAAVLRRASLRASTPEIRDYRRRLIATSLAADMRAAGLEESRVQEELGACMGAIAPSLHAN